MNKQLETIAREDAPHVAAVFAAAAGRHNVPTPTDHKQYSGLTVVCDDVAQAAEVARALGWGFEQSWNCIGWLIVPQTGQRILCDRSAGIGGHMLRAQHYSHVCPCCGVAQDSCEEVAWQAHRRDQFGEDSHPGQERVRQAIRAEMKERGVKLPK